MSRVISLSIPDEMSEGLNKILKEDDRTLSWVVRKAIQEYLEKRKNQ